MTSTFILLAAIALADVDQASAEAQAADVKQMQGDWMVRSMKVNGIKSPPEESQTLFRTVTGTSYTVSRYSKPIVRGTFKLDASKSPRTIDSTLLGAANAEPLLGIYEFEGNLLRICNAPPGKPRPADFQAKLGSGHTLTVWEPETR